MNFTFITLLFSFATFSVEGVRNCYYSCDGCDDNVTELQCPNDDDYCYTMKDGTGLGNRGCVSSELVQNVCGGRSKQDCWVCEGDFCNSAGSHSVLMSFGAMTVVGVLVMTIFS
jgi:hypothetical protein